MHKCLKPTWSPAPWHLHVELHSVHSKDCVPDMAQQVTS